MLILCLINYYVQRTRSSSSSFQLLVNIYKFYVRTYIKSCLTLIPATSFGHKQNKHRKSTWSPLEDPISLRIYTCMELLYMFLCTQYNPHVLLIYSSIVGHIILIRPSMYASTTRAFGCKFPSIYSLLIRTVLILYLFVSQLLLKLNPREWGSLVSSFVHIALRSQRNKN